MLFVFPSCSNDEIKPIGSDVRLDTRPTVDQGGEKDLNKDGSQGAKDLHLASAESCGECHKAHYSDWKGSMHAYATTDPIYLAMLERGINDTQGKIDQFCIQCHAPIASKEGMTPIESLGDGRYGAKFDQSNPLVSGGVVCVTCHAMEKAEATLNAKFELSKTTYYAASANPRGQEEHPVETSTLLPSSVMCGTCHNVVNPKGALIENTFSEWYASPYNDGDADDKTCQDCHMPTYRGEIVDGVTTTIHKHQFVGVDVALVDFPQKVEQRRLVEELLGSAVELEIKRTNDQGDEIAIRVSLKNVNNGHALPSGSTSDRQVWVHLKVFNQADEIVFESGALDAQGDLKDRVEGHSLDPAGDPELLVFGSFLFDDNGEHVNFPWQAARSQDFLLQPGQVGWREYEISKTLVGGQKIRVEAAVNYRTFPPFIVRQLEEEGLLKIKLSDKIPIIKMAEKTITLTIP